MKKYLELISEEVAKAFEEAGYDGALGKVSVSNRPDLCEYQCNGAMAGAKQYHKAPIMIAQDVAAKLQDSTVFSDVNAVAPGFLNLNINPEFFGAYVTEMSEDEFFGFEPCGKGRTIVIDYGGPNVAKPLHVGHLRSAIIGESIKRICRYAGADVIGDIHMGDWGLQMGLIIYELSLRQPDLPYFDDNYTGEYPSEPPFTISELEEIYPTASGKTKETEADKKTLTAAAVAYKAKAMEATAKLQNGDPGYRALWKHIITVSVADLKKNYGNLKVDFDLWYGESTVHDRIPGMVEMMKQKGLAYESEGALVVDIAEETDTREIPPCMILKSDGAALYTTTDLATLQMRREENHPDLVLYVVDKRQELHFTQVFRTARKTGIAEEKTELVFKGFGTMNGKDGHAFKTRDGGVLRLEYLLKEVEDVMYAKITENGTMDDEKARETAKIVALSAVKYGDLSNQASKDYIFDIERFTSSEGNTGVYLLYTMVRIKSILAKVKEQGGEVLSFAELKEKTGSAVTPEGAPAKELMQALAGWNAMIADVYKETAPHRVCAYLYDLANALNHFYHNTHILAEEDAAKKSSYIALLSLTLGIMEQGIDLLGFDAPERM